MCLTLRNLIETVKKPTLFFEPMRGLPEPCSCQNQNIVRGIPVYSLFSHSPLPSVVITNFLPEFLLLPSSWQGKGFSRGHSDGRVWAAWLFLEMKAAQLQYGKHNSECIVNMYWAPTMCQALCWPSPCSDRQTRQDTSFDSTYNLMYLSSHLKYPITLDKYYQSFKKNNGWGRASTRSKV